MTKIVDLFDLGRCTIRVLTWLLSSGVEIARQALLRAIAAHYF